MRQHGAHTTSFTTKQNKYNVITPPEHKGNV
jgi:hypothetical protein